MNRASLVKNSGILCAVFLMSCFQSALQGMEGVVAEEIAGAGIRLEGAAEEALARSMTEELGNLDKAAVEGMSGELKSALETEIKESLQNVSKGLEKGGMTAEKAAQFGKNAASEIKGNLVKDLEKSGSMTVKDAAGVQKLNLSSEEKAVVGKIEPKGENLAMPEGAEYTPSPAKLNSLENKAAVASDSVVQNTAEKTEAGLQKIEGLAEKDAGKVAQAEQKIKAVEAKEPSLKKNSETADTQLKTKKTETVTEAKAKEEAAVTKTETAAKSGSGKEAAAAEEDTLKASKVTDNAEADAAATKRLSAKQKYEQAQTELDGLKTQKKDIETKIKEAKAAGTDTKALETERDIVNEDIIAKKAEVTTAHDNFLDTTANWEIMARVKRFGKTRALESLNGLKTVAEGLDLRFLTQLFLWYLVLQ